MPPAKKLFKGRYTSKISSATQPTDRSIRGQLERYLTWDHGECNGVIDAVSFWCNEKVNPDMPGLTKMARRVLSTPASSAPVERVFFAWLNNFEASSIKPLG